MRSNKIIIAIIGLTAWVALALQLYILIDNTPGNGLTPLGAVGRFLHFFTILSNLLVAVSLSVLLVAPASPAGRFFAKPSSLAGIALYIFIAGLVYNTMLRNLWHPQGMQKTADELLHVAVPLLYLSYWLIFSVKRSLKWTHAIKWLAFPAAYLVYIMIRGAIEGFYPYPFIDVSQFGYSTVALNSAGFLAVFIAAGLLFVYIGKTMSRRE